MQLTYNTMHFDVKGRRQEVEHCKFWIAALTLPHTRDFHSLLLTEESSVLFQRLFLAHVRQVLTLKAYKICFYSNYHKLELMCKRKRDEPHLVFVSAKSLWVSHCLPWAQLSTVIFREKSGLVILFVQVCSTLLSENSLTTFRSTLYIAKLRKMMKLEDPRS